MDALAPIVLAELRKGFRQKLCTRAGAGASKQIKRKKHYGRSFQLSTREFEGEIVLRDKAVPYNG